MLNGSSPRGGLEDVGDMGPLRVGRIARRRAPGHRLWEPLGGHESETMPASHPSGGNLALYLHKRSEQSLTDDQRRQTGRILLVARFRGVPVERSFLAPGSAAWAASAQNRL
jgi:hypothetical protein